jgi:hypothetical protein
VAVCLFVGAASNPTRTSAIFSPAPPSKTLFFSLRINPNTTVRPGGPPRPHPPALRGLRGAPPGRQVPRRAGETYIYEVFFKTAAARRRWRCRPEPLTLIAPLSLLHPIPLLCKLFTCNMYLSTDWRRVGSAGEGPRLELPAHRRLPGQPRARLLFHRPRAVPHQREGAGRQDAVRGRAEGGLRPTAAEGRKRGRREGRAAR